jgi:hypothetical protein
MNVEIGAEAALFPEKEYKNRIAVAVYMNISLPTGKSLILQEYISSYRNFSHPTG